MYISTTVLSPNEINQNGVENWKCFFMIFFFFKYKVILFYMKRHSPAFLIEIVLLIWSCMLDLLCIVNLNLISSDHRERASSGARTVYYTTSAARGKMAMCAALMRFSSNLSVVSPTLSRTVGHQILTRTNRPISRTFCMTSWLSQGKNNAFYLRSGWMWSPEFTKNMTEHAASCNSFDTITSLFCYLLQSDLLTFI